MSDSSHKPFLSPRAAGVVGVLLTIVGLASSWVAVTSALSEVAQPSGDLLKFLFCLGFLALPLLVAGVASLYYAYRQQKHSRKRQLHHTVLELAQSDPEGSVTPSEVALNSHVTLEEAQAFLEDLNRRGINRMEIDDDGHAYFVFERRKALE